MIGPNKEGKAMILTNEVNQLIADYDVDTIMASASHLIAEQCTKLSAPLTSPDLVRQYLLYALSCKAREEFHAIYMNSQHEVIAFVVEATGTIDGTSVYPREIAKSALRYNAAAVIFAHNHPSGVAEPSEADKRITKRLIAALELFDIRVLDHLVLGHGEFVSFAEQGLL